MATETISSASDAEKAKRLREFLLLVDGAYLLKEALDDGKMDTSSLPGPWSAERDNYARAVINETLEEE